MMFIYAWNRFSEGARVLRDAIGGCLVIRYSGSSFRGSPKKTVINWGSSAPTQEVLKSNVLNRPEAVLRTSNKLEFFRSFQTKEQTEKEKSAETLGRVVPWTESRDQVREWMDSSKSVLARTILNGHSGLGIKVLTKGLDIPPAGVYTMYIPKRDEYRVHIVRGSVIFCQRKSYVKSEDRKPNDLTFMIRVHRNGFIYAHKDIIVPEDVTVQALKVFNQIPGLDFGAVDVLWNDKQAKAYVLEINTAPGLTQTTAEKYAKEFRKITV